MRSHISAFLLSITFTSAAQFYSLPAEHSFQILTDKTLARRDSFVHPGIQPYIPFLNPNFSHVRDQKKIFRYIQDDPGIDIAFMKHLITVKPKDEPFHLTIDPVINFEGGRDLADSTGAGLYTNTRGLVAAGTVGRKFYFESMFVENQSVLPQYLADEARRTGVVPGQGRWKTFKRNGFDYAFATGLSSIQLSSNVNLQFGHGKHKAGHGYRSLLLSDNAFNYPYARLTQQWFKGRLRYTNLYASLMNLVQASKVLAPHTERLFQKKSAAFQHLELQPFRFLNISLFQGVIWQAGDERNRQRLTWEYFNPVIFGQLASFGLEHPRHNVLVGSDLLLKLSDRVSLYSQVMADRVKGRGVQGGLKYFDAFGLRHLTLQAEYNSTERFTYSSVSAGDYDHYGQGLGYTLPNGREAMAMLDYRRDRFYVNLKYHDQEFTGGRSSITHLRAGYVINTAYNLNVSAGYLGRRNFPNLGPSNPGTHYVYLSVKTSIYNLYYDF